MKKLLDRSVIGSGLALLSPATLAAQLEDVQAFVGMAGVYGLILITVVVALYAYSMQPLDKRATPLRRVLNGSDAIYAVAADALVMECTRKMTESQITALIVMDGERLIGIFSQRDAVSRVLAAGRDPRGTKVCEVMTMNPCCVSPEMTVGDAMALVANRRFGHLPVVESGKVRAVLSSRELTHWLAENRVGAAQELVELAIRS